MRTTAPRAFLLAVLALLLGACAPQSTRKISDDSGAAQDLLIPPKASAPVSGPAARQPRTAAKSGAPTPDAATATSTAWPLLLTYEGTKFQVQEPVVESWLDGILTARSLVTAQPPDQRQGVLGSLTMKASAQADSAAGVASLVDTEVLGVSFPAGVDSTQAWQEFLRFAVPPLINTVPLATLESGRKITRARQQAAASAEVTPPRIIVSERAAVLVYIDGDPRYVPVAGTDLMGVLNTRVLLLKDPQGNNYLHLYDGWVRAPSLDGPWEVAFSPPDMRGLEQAIRETRRANFLFGKVDANGRSPILSEGHLPDILVATQPTALIVLDGPPHYASVVGTSLQYAANTSAHLFRDTKSGSVYVRVDGFWFRAADTKGPWGYVPVANLPAAFSAIPVHSPKRAVKASIAGAQAPTSANDMNLVVAGPGDATLKLNMAGDPVLKTILGTDLNSVTNSSVPIIQVDINNWYAVQNGVWFFATEVTGPWTVTSDIPMEFYSIPPGTPVYHAIHSRVMASSNDVNYPGYQGDVAQTSGGGVLAIEDQGADYQYTPPSGMSWGWFY